MPRQKVHRKRTEKIDPTGNEIRSNTLAKIIQNPTAEKNIANIMTVAEPTPAPSREEEKIEKKRSSGESDNSFVTNHFSHFVVLGLRLF